MVLSRYCRFSNGSRMHEDNEGCLNTYFTVVIAVMSDLELHMKDNAVLVHFITQILLFLELSN